MASREKKSAKQAAPATAEVDAEIIEEAPRPSSPPAVKASGAVAGEVLAPARKPRRATKAKPAAAEPQAPEAEPDDEEEGEEVEPSVEELTGAEPIDAALPKLPVLSRDSKLGRRDPLSAYMAEVTQHPLLTREEELSLARRYRDTGDVKAAYKLVASNLRLVVKLAHEYHRNPIALLDLIQEGNIGLMQAVKKFDPERGVKLSSYAAWWIRAYILRFIMDNWKMVKLGTTEAQRKLFFKLRQEQERLAQQGLELSPKLLAERLSVTEQDVIDMDQRLGHDEVSLDAPASPDDESKQTRGDRLLTSGAVGADESLGNAELKALFSEKLAEFATGLNEKERYIFEKRLTSDEPLTLQDIGAHFGVSRERARQIEAALIDRMRTHMKAHIPDFEMMASPDRD